MGRVNRHRAKRIEAARDAQEPATTIGQARAKFGAEGKEIAVERRARWAHLRHILTEAWVNGRPMRTIDDIQERLLRNAGADVSRGTIERDLHALGAIRIIPEGDAPEAAFFVIPPYVPEAEDLRSKLSADVIAIETEHRIAAYVVEMFPWKDFVIINTDRNCGQMVADIIALNPWPELVHVQASAHSVLVLCANPKAAETAWLRMNRQYAEVPRYRVAATRVRRRSTGSFLDYFQNPEITKHEEGGDDDEG